MDTIAIITLLLAVPAAIVALISLLKKANGEPKNANLATPERTTAQNVYELTCAYAPKAWIVISLFNVNYQNANPMLPALAGAEANNVVGHGIENNDTPSNDGVDELPRPVQDGYH